MRLNKMNKSVIGLCSLLLISSFWLHHSSIANAMGGPPPEEKPKYKLEILKMDVISAGQSKEAGTILESSGEEPKYKLEILKMDVITAPGPSPEAKGSKPH